MLREPGLVWTTVPVPSHKGIIISPGVLKFYDLKDIKMLLICEDFDRGFEKIDQMTEIKFVKKIERDSLWIVKWRKYEDINFGIVLGSEI